MFKTLGGAVKEYVDTALIINLFILTSLIISNITSYKAVDFHGVVMSLGTFTMPVILALLNPVTEVVGYAYSKKLMITCIVCEVVFAISVHYMALIPSNDPTLSAAYQLVTQHIIRGSLSFAIGGMIGAYINSKVLICLKFIFKSKYYAIRDIVSSAIGETIYVVVCFSIAFYGVFPILHIVSMSLASLLIKFAASFVLALPSQWVLVALKAHYKNLPDSNKYSSFKIRI